MSDSPDNSDGHRDNQGCTHTQMPRDEARRLRTPMHVGHRPANHELGYDQNYNEPVE